MAKRRSDMGIGERTEPARASEALAVGVEPAERVGEHELCEQVERTHATEMHGAHLVDEQWNQAAQGTRLVRRDPHERWERVDEQMGAQSHGARTVRVFVVERAGMPAMTVI